jgi:hypothetical protein
VNSTGVDTTSGLAVDRRLEPVLGRVHDEAFAAALRRLCIWAVEVELPLVEPLPLAERRELEDVRIVGGEHEPALDKKRRRS